MQQQNCVDDFVPGLAASGTTAASSALVVSAPQALQTSPLRDVCSFKITVADMLANTISQPLTVWVIVNTNRKPLVGTGIGAFMLNAQMVQSSIQTQILAKSARMASTSRTADLS
ncbi:hypothetical protein HDU89_008350 [Geranomyces variabilis]|nr:hypothetical protein HDU89_008350 [Geranomyces variabilis]